MSRFAKLWASAAIIPALGYATAVYAADYTIDSAVTETNGGNVLDGDDTIIVTNTG